MIACWLPKPFCSKIIQAFSAKRGAIESIAVNASYALQATIKWVIGVWLVSASSAVKASDWQVCGVVNCTWPGNACSRSAERKIRCTDCFTCARRAAHKQPKLPAPKICQWMVETPVFIIKAS